MTFKKGNTYSKGRGRGPGNLKKLPAEAKDVLARAVYGAGRLPRLCLGSSLIHILV